MRVNEMFLFFFIGCFSPKLGQWAFHDVEISGDCALDQTTSPDVFVMLTDSDAGFVLQREDDSFSCLLDGVDFSCSTPLRDVDAEEVLLSVEKKAEGSFDNRVAGHMLISEAWSCVSGDCDTYGLSKCTASFDGSLALSQTE